MFGSRLFIGDQLQRLGGAVGGVGGRHRRQGVASRTYEGGRHRREGQGDREEGGELQGEVEGDARHDREEGGEEDGEGDVADQG